MLTPRHLATLRAALLYWHQEMCPHGPEAMRPYFEPPENPPLSGEEVANVRQGLLTGVRYAVYDPQQDSLASKALFPTPELAEQHRPGAAVATVILPAVPTIAGAG